MDKLEKKTVKYKTKIDKRSTSSGTRQIASSNQTSGRLIFYVLWFCITYIVLLNYISNIEWLSILYPLTLLTAFLKDLLVDRKLIAAGKTRLVWFEHSGILLAFIIFAMASELYRVPSIGITSVLMTTDLVIDLMQDLGILKAKSVSHVEFKEEREADDRHKSKLKD